VSPVPWPNGRIAETGMGRHHGYMEEADVLLLLTMLGDIREHVAAIRRELEDGEEEEDS